MNDNKRELQNPPVVVALFQMKYSPIDIKEFDSQRGKLSQYLPVQRNSIHVGLEINKPTLPLGRSQVSGISDASIGSYVFASQDQKTKLEISADTITYVDESPYQGWDNFQSSVINLLNIIQGTLSKIEIIRTSIRFINRITLHEFSSPEDYFTSVISTTQEGNSVYPLRQYNFKVIMDIPETDIYAIVNHNAENDTQGKVIYTLDIDVLDRQCLIYNEDTVKENMNRLRDIKNNIFFNTLTEKTLAICNSQN